MRFEGADGPANLVDLAQTFVGTEVMVAKSRLGWLVVAALVAVALAACRHDHRSERTVHGQMPIEAAPRTATTTTAGMHTHADGTTHTHSHVHAEGQAGHGAHVHAAANEKASFGSAHPENDPNAACTCEQDIYHNTWCRRCNMGFIAGVPISHAILFDTIDPHGHAVDFSTFDCAACRRNISNDGWCEPCSTGFYNKQAYFTRLTHGIAQGTTLNPGAMKCDTCRSHLGETGWCDACRKGVVGNVAITDRNLYQTTAREYTILLAAIVKADACEECACAMTMHRTCPKCQISYAGIARETPVP